jgi:predicted small secreted protein
MTAIYFLLAVARSPFRTAWLNHLTKRGTKPNANLLRAAGPTFRSVSPKICMNHDSGRGDEGGITISRRPNSRPSTENAPGPSKAITVAVMIIPKAISLTSCNPHEGVGNQARAIPKKHNPTKNPPQGVRNPMDRAVPLMVKSKPSNHLAQIGPFEPDKYCKPTAIAAAPKAVRSSNSPNPGRPPGNVENSLCSSFLLVARDFGHTTRDNT